MNNAVIGWIVLGLLAIAGLALAYYERAPSGEPQAPASTTPFATAPASTITLTGGVVSISYPSGVYALATAGEPLLVHPYIPPCDSPFSYCIYRVGTEYASTTFESAGVRISSRPDLTSQAACLSTPPAGYASSTPAMVTNASYAASAFGPLSDAATGHYSSGTLYRLWAEGTCTEFETRIGESQYANYPPGMIGQFTSADRSAVLGELSAIMSRVKVASTTVAWPAAPVPTAP